MLSLEDKLIELKQSNCAKEKWLLEWFKLTLLNQVKTIG